MANPGLNKIGKLSITRPTGEILTYSYVDETDFRRLSINLAQNRESLYQRTRLENQIDTHPGPLQEFMSQSLPPRFQIEEYMFSLYRLGFAWPGRMRRCYTDHSQPLIRLKLWGITNCALTNIIEVVKVY